MKYPSHIQAFSNSWNCYYHLSHGPALHYSNHFGQFSKMCFFDYFFFFATSCTQISYNAFYFVIFVVVVAFVVLNDNISIIDK